MAPDCLKRTEATDRSCFPSSVQHPRVPSSSRSKLADRAGDCLEKRNAAAARGIRPWGSDRKSGRALYVSRCPDLGTLDRKVRRLVDRPSCATSGRYRAVAECAVDWSPATPGRKRRRWRNYSHEQLRSFRPKRSFARRGLFPGSSPVSLLGTRLYFFLSTFSDFLPSLPHGVLDFSLEFEGAFFLFRQFFDVVRVWY